MIQTISTLLGELSWLEFLSRAGVASTWVLALYQILRSRHAPMANQAFVSACALVLGQVLLIYSIHFPPDILNFFIATAQIVMAISVVKIFRWSSHLTHKEINRIKAVEHAEAVETGHWKTYAKSIGLVALSGLLYFALHAWESLSG